MYKKKIDLKDIKLDNSLISDLLDGDVYQITQKGHNVKVIMTQEYFFQLMARLEKIEGITQALKYDPEKLMSNFEKLLTSDRDFKKVEDEIENSLPRKKIQL